MIMWFISVHESHFVHALPPTEGMNSAARLADKVKE